MLNIRNSQLLFRQTGANYPVRNLKSKKCNQYIKNKKEYQFIVHHHFNDTYIKCR